LARGQWKIIFTLRSESRLAGGGEPGRLITALVESNRARRPPGSLPSRVPHHGSALSARLEIEAAIVNERIPTGTMIRDENDGSCQPYDIPGDEGRR